MTNRTFGVEIEFDSNDQGLDFCKDLFEKNDLSHWKDWSFDGSELEISSPILQGSTGLVEVRKVLSLLKKNKCNVGEEDGLHVHIGAKELFIGKRVKLFGEWMEDGTSYPGIDTLIDSWEEIMDLVDDVLATWRIDGYYCSKSIGNSEYDGYPGVRMQYGYQTVEFRQLEGTFDFWRVASWIRFTQAFIESVVANTPLKADDTMGLLKAAGLSSAACSRLLNRPESV